MPDTARLTQLSIKSAPVLKAFLRAQYREQLEAQGGPAPYTWKLTHGSLPPGISLEPSGVLSGLPTETGDFHFVVTISDSGRPAHQRNQELVLRVLAPLLIQWGRQAMINGQRIEGSIKVSNQTGQDFDLTEVVVAVNEIGRATALGYQHFPLKQNTIDFEIPFGENLPPVWVRGKCGCRSGNCGDEHDPSGKIGHRETTDGAGALRF